jgi:hypothetical protein
MPCVGCISVAAWGTPYFSDSILVVAYEALIGRKIPMAAPKAELVSKYWEDHAYIEKWSFGGFAEDTDPFTD